MRRLLTWLSACFLIPLSTLVSLSGPAQAGIEGSCLDYFIPASESAQNTDLRNYDRRSGKIYRVDLVKVMVESTAIREEPDAGSRAVRSLEFGDLIKLVRLDGDFVEVQLDPRYEDTIVGWVHADDILCRATPLVTEDGVSRKLFIRTAANVMEEEEQAIEPKAGPESEKCAELIDGNCQSLTRFTRFFIYAEDHENGKLLLNTFSSTDYTLPMIGWIDEESGYRWNTRLGLRPTDGMRINEATGRYEESPEEVIACIYETEQEARNPSSEGCKIPVLGGARWFTSSIRLPILDEKKIDDRTFYHVAVPVAGVGENSREDLLEQVAGLDNAIEALQDLKDIDVFFLIDGTQSMAPHIEAIANKQNGVIPAIKASFEDDPRFRNVKVRYGYRIYRDSYAGNFGISSNPEDRMRLDRNCDPTTAEIKANHDAFEVGMSKIDTEYGTGLGKSDPDDEEALIVGLGYAVNDINACEENVKLLFVIGDTGYDSARLKSEGAPIHDTDKVVDLLVKGVSSNTIDPIIPFFIHVPEAAVALNRKGEALERYRRAYDKFDSQGRAIINAVSTVYAESQVSPVTLDEGKNFFSLGGQNEVAARQALVHAVKEYVADFANQEPVNAIIAGLQTGDALVEIITALQDASLGVPALRLAQIERRICDTLGEACTKKIISDTAFGYIEANDQIVVDVSLTSDELGDWRRKLEPLREHNLKVMEITEQSKLVVELITEGIGKSTGELSPRELNLSLKDFLKLKQGLPVNTQTPLMNYKLRDFVYATDNITNLSGDAIEACELHWVVKWLEKRRLIFHAVDRGVIPVFWEEDISPSICPLRYPTTKQVIYEAELPFPDPKKMDFSFVQFETRQFWVPNRYFP